MNQEEPAALGFEAMTGRAVARRALSRAFAAAGIASADLDARVLLCAALGVDHAALVREPDHPLGSGAALLAAFAVRRLEREPVSRIVGWREFWGARFALAPATLDPRADTETLVEAVLEEIGADAGRGWRVLDLGVGSGAILGALLKSLPNAFGVGLDIAPAACAIARDNLAANELGDRGSVFCGDWTRALSGRFDVIVSNPPYIRRADIECLAPEVSRYDPALALDGGPDGLDAYRAIVPAAAALLAPEGIFALEFGAGQSEEVAAILAAQSFKKQWFRRDLGGRRRVIVVRRD